MIYRLNRVRNFFRNKRVRFRVYDVIHQSETSLARPRLARFCVGNGIDLGFGGDPITESAIRMDYPRPYTKVGDFPVQLGGDATSLYWFKDGVLDYLYSSHLLEDFDDTKAVLVEWLRVLKPGGLLIIFCPDQQVYEAHCRRTGQPENLSHKHADFSLDYVKKILAELGETDVVHEIRLVNTYSWDLVVRKAGLAVAT